MLVRTRLLTKLAPVLALAQPASAADFCVATGSGLQSALTVAQNNGESDHIRLRAGTYTRIAPGTAFTYASSEDFNLSLTGGWNAGCTDTSFDPPTILDGGDARRVMEIASLGAGTAAAIGVFQLQFSNGLAAADGGGLRIVGAAGNSMEVTLVHNTFVGNVAGTSGGGLSASGNGRLQVVNNLFVANEAQVSFGAAALNSNGDSAFVSHNTIIGNVAPSTGGVRYGGSSLLHLANNILWANGDNDLLVLAGSSHFRYHNNIGAVTAPAPGILVGEITTAPEFEPGLFNFVPRPRGALFNAGIAAPPGGMVGSDLAGRPRVSAGLPDIGAYEAEVLFYDGFQP